MRASGLGWAALCAAVLWCGSTAASAQDARQFVRQIVSHELIADQNDHSKWMFRDDRKVPEKSTVKLVVQTGEGSVSELIQQDGHPPTPAEKKDDQAKRHAYVTDPSVRAKQRENDKHDDEQAASMTKMLPDAFLWTITGQNGDETTLHFKPDPKFQPPTREAKVFASMEGNMVVNRKQQRIKILKGTLVQEVDFGWGLLGKLDKGGTFDVERQQIAPGIWQITATHIHIQGHALIFKSISEEQDETTSHYKPTPPGLTLEKAAQMLENGTVAKMIGVQER